jgi:WD40 repeat protein
VPSNSIPIVYLAFGPLGDRLAMTTSDGRVLMGDPPSDSALEVLPVSALAGSGLAFSPDGQRLAFVDPEGDVRIWLVQERRVASTAFVHALPQDRREHLRWRIPARLEFLTESRLAILFGDGCLTYWDADRLVEDEMRPGASVGPRLELAISPDKKTVAVNDIADSVIIVEAGEVARTVARIPSTLPASALVFSPDSRELAIGLQNGPIRLVDKATGADLRSFVGHQMWTAALAFAPDGLTLASAGSDGTARLWDVPTGQELATIERRSGALTAVAFSPDGRFLAVAGVPHGEGPTVSIYDAGPAGDDPVGERARIGIGIDAPTHHESGSSTKSQRSPFP